MKRAFLDALFPIHCPGCGREGTWACSDCIAALRVAPLNFCPGCGLSSPGGLAHKRCSDRESLDGLVSLYHYADPFLRGLIKDYKYHGATEIGAVLAALASAAVRKAATVFPPGATVVPLPLHVLREKRRGFNQSEKLAKAIAEALGARIEKPLKRAKATAEQARLGTAERQENCRDAFVSSPLSGDYILVDDVVTTGATMKAAAAAMKKAGASRVIGFALAHGRGDELWTS